MRYSFLQSNDSIFLLLIFMVLTMVYCRVFFYCHVDVDLVFLLILLFFLVLVLVPWYNYLYFYFLKIIYEREEIRARAVLFISVFGIILTNIFIKIFIVISNNSKTSIFIFSNCVYYGFLWVLTKFFEIIEIYF